MTTERGARTSALEMRLYVVALLAVVYTISWRTIGGHQAAAVEPAPATRVAPRVVTIGTHGRVQPPRVERVPNRRVPRVRTRSS